jgi:subtilase family serine protease
MTKTFGRAAAIGVRVLFSVGTTSIWFISAVAEPYQGAALRIDSGVQRERAIYAKLHIEERYGIVFHPYASVCAKRTRHAARCFAKVLTNDAGLPLTFDPAKQDLPGYTPKQLRAAYGVSGVANGAPIIGIVAAYAYPNAVSDLKAYSKQTKLPALANCKGGASGSAEPCIQIVNEKGGNKLPTTVDPSWAAEQAIDLQMAHALCENCSIVLVEADSDGFNDMLPAENTAAKLGATVISNSWGNTETSGDTGLDQSYFNHPGVAIVASTGDEGYAGGVLWPASSPNVVAVGGTTLLLSKNDKKYSSEVAWDGSGSGCSAVEARPSWQPSLPGCPNNRTVSDISVDADPNTGVAIYDSTQCSDGASCWFEMGGTSVSAPIVAGMFAVAGTLPPSATQAASILYQNATKKNSRDIITGSNGECGFTYLCNAVAGYDGPTGLGSPRGLDIFIATDAERADAR